MKRPDNRMAVAETRTPLGRCAGCGVELADLRDVFAFSVRQKGGGPLCADCSVARMDDVRTPARGTRKGRT